MRTDPLKSHTENTRRDFLKGLAKTCLGVEIGRSTLLGSSLTTLNQFSHAEASATAPRDNPAKSIIYLYMNGGMSQHDTFAPKAGAKPFYDSINTKADDIVVSSLLEKTSKHMHKASIIHSMTSTDGGHPAANYHMPRSYSKRSDIVHPPVGSWISKLKGKNNPDLPAFVNILGSSGQCDAGWLGGNYTGALIKNPNDGLANINKYYKVSDEAFASQLDLLNKANSEFFKKFPQQQVSSMQDVYGEATKTMLSKDLVAFDINQESSQVRERYGNSKFGQGCLLAARLAEAGVTFSQVSFNGWDMHYGIESSLANKVPELDQVLSALLEDLERRGILDSTLVVVASEFGRDWRHSDVNVGRGHQPASWSHIFFGGGVKQGFTYGATDKNNNKITENPVTYGDFNATLAYGLGVNPNTILYSPSGRPFQVGGKKGKAVADIFA